MINKLNREQESLLGVYREKWTNIGLSCDPCDFGEAKSAAIEAYAAAGLPPPEMFFRFRSPVSAAIGTAIIKELMRVKGAGAMTSVGASVRDSVGASVWASVGASVRASVWEMTFGSHDAGFLGLCEYYRDVLAIPGASKASALIRLGKCCGWWAAYQNVAIFQDRHETLHRDNLGRLHAEDGPAVKYRDGWGVWAIHGVRVDEQVVVRPETQTIEQIKQEKNEEVRIERFGWARYLDECGAKVVDRRRNDIDTQRETLYQMDDGSKRLRVRDPSTGREYALGVPRDVDTCEAAQRWLSHGLSDRCIGRT